MWTLDRLEKDCRRCCPDSDWPSSGAHSEVPNDMNRVGFEVPNQDVAQKLSSKVAP